MHFLDVCMWFLLQGSSLHACDCLLCDACLPFRAAMLYLCQYSLRQDAASCSGCGPAD